MKTSAVKLPRVDCSRGAPMGRAEKHLEPAGRINFRLRLQHVRLDSGGYDNGGAYWGLRPSIVRDFVRPDGYTVKLYHTPRLYWYHHTTKGGNAVLSGFVDAASRKDAKAEIRKQYPNVTFYN